MKVELNSKEIGMLIDALDIMRDAITDGFCQFGSMDDEERDELYGEELDLNLNKKLCEALKELKG